MNPARKMTVVAIAAIFMLVVLLAFGMLMTEEMGPVTDSSEPVSDQMWEMRPLDLMILSVMLFAGVLGVLALVGGEFKWS